MNSSALRQICLIGVAALFMSLPLRAATPPTSDTDTLKVQVIVPPTWNLLIDDKVSESLVDRVRDVFYRAGFTMPVSELRLPEDPSKVPCLLTINLTEWRINRIGNIDCACTASLKTPRGTRELGLYTNTTMQWLDGPGRFGLSRSFVEAAEGALRTLYTDLAHSDLLPNSSNRSHA